MPAERKVTPRRLGAAFLRILVMLVIVFPILVAATNVYRIPRAVDTTPADYGVSSYRDVAFTTSDGLQISGWLLPPTGGPARAVIVICHGVGANRLDVLERAMFLLPKGFACLLFDWRDHGNSQGRRTTFGFQEWRELRAAIDFVGQELPGLPIGVLAQSMGAAINVLSADRVPEVKAYVLDSAFTSLWEMTRETYKAVPGPLMTPFQHAVGFWGSFMVGGSINDISPEAVVSRLAPRPVLFIHGAADRWIPPDHARRLFAAYQGPKDLWLAPGAGHVQSHMRNKAEFEKRVLAHYERWLTAPPN